MTLFSLNDFRLVVEAKESPKSVSTPNVTRMTLGFKHPRELLILRSRKRLGSSQLREETPGAGFRRLRILGGVIVIIIVVGGEFEDGFDGRKGGAARSGGRWQSDVVLVESVESLTQTRGAEASELLLWVGVTAEGGARWLSNRWVGGGIH